MSPGVPGEGQVMNTRSSVLLVPFTSVASAFTWYTVRGVRPRMVIECEVLTTPSVMSMP